MPDSPLGSKRWNLIEDAIMERCTTLQKNITAALFADGPPPFHEALPPRERYQTLLALRDANSPIYWHDPAAIRELYKLAYQFGPTAPASGIPPYPSNSGMPFPTPRELSGA